MQPSLSPAAAAPALAVTAIAHARLEPDATAVLTRLQELLDGGDGEAIEVFQAQRQQLLLWLGEPATQAMATQLSRYAFEAAAASLRAARAANPAAEAAPGQAP